MDAREQRPNAKMQDGSTAPRGAPRPFDAMITPGDELTLPQTAERSPSAAPTAILRRSWFRRLRARDSYSNGLRSTTHLK